MQEKLVWSLSRIRLPQHQAITLQIDPLVVFKRESNEILFLGFEVYLFLAHLPRIP